jgi:hypothetical protein
MRRSVLVVIVVVSTVACSGKSPKITDAREADATVFDAQIPDDAGIDAVVGAPGTGIVTGAVKASSSHFSLFGTLRSGDGSSTSPSFHRRGGITGATQ